MTLLLLIKAKRAAIGSISPSGKYRKIAEGKWIPVKRREDIPAPQGKVKVPPAWINVQYFSDPKSKLWVKGDDIKGRTQYIYNPEHVTEASKEKFARIRALNNAYPDIQKQVAADVRAKKDAALALWLIMSTGIRPGSEKDTKGSTPAYGATTLEGRHVKPYATGLRLEFTGKKGVSLSIPVNDVEVVKMLKSKARKAGKNGRLFQVTGDGLLRYSKGLSNGAGFQSKDFRTYLGTKVAMKAMRGKHPSTMKEYRKAVREVGNAVAAQLGNTRAVALQSYINPAIFEKWRKRIEGA